MYAIIFTCWWTIIMWDLCNTCVPNVLTPSAMSHAFQVWRAYVAMSYKIIHLSFFSFYLFQNFLCTVFCNICLTSTCHRYDPKAQMQYGHWSLVSYLRCLTDGPEWAFIIIWVSALQKHNEIYKKWFSYLQKSLCRLK